MVDCAERLNLLRPDARALGMGVGREVLMFYFARHCQEVIATDLYSSDTEWREANTGALEEIYQAAPFDYPRERLKVEVADMRKTNYPDNSFDFVWSCGSVEHVPSLFDVYQTLVETYRVLKPGGYALLTTEYCISDPPYLFNGMNALDSKIVATVFDNLGGLKLVGPIDLSFNYVHPITSVATRQYISAPIASKTQQFALSWDYVHMLGISAIIPIGLVLQKTGGGITKWEGISLPHEYRVYDNAVNLHSQESPETALHELIELVYSPKGDLPRQLHLQAICTLLCYADNKDNPNFNKNTANLLELFLSLMPEGELQDPSLLEYIAPQFCRKKEFDKALELYRLAALSPSAFADHAISLAIEHLKLRLEMKRDITDDDPLPMIIKDLLLHGYSMSWIKSAMLSVMKADELAPILEQTLNAAKSAVRNQLEERLR